MTNITTITDIKVFSRRMIFTFIDGSEQSVPFRFPAGNPNNPGLGFGGSEPTVRDIIGRGPITIEDRGGIFFIDSSATAGGGYDFIVDINGTGDFTDIPAAIIAAEARGTPYTIALLAGTYSGFNASNLSGSIEGMGGQGSTIITSKVTLTDTPNYSLKGITITDDLEFAGTSLMVTGGINMEVERLILSNTGGGSVFIPDTVSIINPSDATPTIERTAGSMSIDGHNCQVFRNGANQSANAAIDVSAGGTGFIRFFLSKIQGQVLLDNSACTFTHQTGEHVMAGTTPHYSANSFGSAIFSTNVLTTSLGGANVITPSLLAQFFFCNLQPGTAGTLIDTTMGTRFGADGINWLSNATSDFVGLGVQPDSKFHVHTGSAGPVAPIANTIITAEGSGDAFISILGGAANKRGIVFGDDANNQDASIIIDGSLGLLEFIHVGTRIMTMSSAGNVAIGDLESVSSKLHVQESSVGTNPTGGVVIAAERNGNCFLSLMSSNASSSAVIFANAGNANAGSIRYNVGDVPDGLEFRVNNNTTRMALDSDGALGLGITSPDSSSILDITTTTRGILMPRMTITQRDAISTPATGLEIYNTTTNKTQYFNGIIWKDSAAPDVRTFAGTNDTLILNDQNNEVISTGAAVAFIAIPTEASVAFPIPTFLTILQEGTGTVNIVAAGGVTLNGVVAGSGGITAQYGLVILQKRATNTWIVSGDIGTVI